MERGPDTSGLTPTFWGGKVGCVPLGSSRCSSRSAGLKSRVRGHQQQEVVGPIPREEGGGGVEEMEPRGPPGSVLCSGAAGHPSRVSPKSKNPHVRDLEQLHPMRERPCGYLPPREPHGQSFLAKEAETAVRRPW